MGKALTDRSVHRIHKKCAGARPVLLLFCCACFLAGCLGTGENRGREKEEMKAAAGKTTLEEEKKREGQEVSIHFLKAGKADCILIFTEAETIVIDTAEEDDGEKIIDYLTEHGRMRIDFLILTHFDKDHMGGADLVLEKIPTGHIYRPDYEEDSKQFEQYQKVVKEASLDEKLVTGTETIDLSCAKLCIEPSRVANAMETNENSMIVSLYHGENSFLFAGDVMGRRSQELIINDIGHYNVLKVPHHGRADRFNESLFDRISPEIAVITDSEKHPAERETQELLGQLGAEIYETKDGTIVLDSDGEKIIVSLE